MQSSWKNVLYYASMLLVSCPKFCAKTKLYTTIQTFSLDFYVFIQVVSSFWQQNQSDKLVGVYVGILVIADLFLFRSGFPEQQICNIWVLFKFLAIIKQKISSAADMLLQKFRIFQKSGKLLLQLYQIKSTPLLI